MSIKGALLEGALLEGALLEGALLEGALLEGALLLMSATWYFANTGRQRMSFGTKLLTIRAIILYSLNPGYLSSPPDL